MYKEKENLIIATNLREKINPDLLNKRLVKEALEETCNKFVLIANFLAYKLSDNI